MTSARPIENSRVEFARIMTLLDANSMGNVHGGVIMREVDSAAGAAATRHAGRPAVTAAIDELSFLAPVHVGDILFVKAQVNYVGSTSMEVGVRVEAEPWQGGDRRHTTSAYLVFVALDDEDRPVAVPRLEITSDVDRRRAEQAEIRRDARKERIERVGAWMPERGEAFARSD